MKWPWRKAVRLLPDSAPPPAEQSVAAQKQAFLLSTIADLLALIRSMPLSAENMNVAHLRSGLDEFLEVLQQSDNVDALKLMWQRQEHAVAEFIKRQKDDIYARETEFQTIIDLLSKVVFDNRSFTSHVLEKTRDMDRISDLGDLRKLKEALKAEIGNLQKDIVNRQRQNDDQIESLKAQVTLLNAELQNALQDSYRDFLTGAFNRQAFEKYISNMVNEVVSSGRGLTMMLVDIDNLKNILLRFGQSIADRVILATAEECRKLINSEDFLSHCAPGSFVIVMPDENLFNACGKARTLCSIIARSRYAVDKSPTSPRLKFTVSIGVSQLQPEDTVFSFTERAVEALYDAKRQGKNRVVPGKVQAMWSRINEFRGSETPRQSGGSSEGTPPG